MAFACPPTSGKPAFLGGTIHALARRQPVIWDRGLAPRDGLHACLRLVVSAHVFERLDGELLNRASAGDRGQLDPTAQ